MKAFCCWCWKPIKVPDDFNQFTGKAVCSQGCRDAETLFSIHFNDKNIADRAIWEKLHDESRDK